MESTEAFTELTEHTEGFTEAMELFTELTEGFTELTEHTEGVHGVVSCLTNTLRAAQTQRRGSRSKVVLHERCFGPEE